MKTRFLNHIASITDPKLRECCYEIQNVPAFFTHPAAMKHHHAYEGGLLAHTVEVIDFALGVAGLNVTGSLDGAPWQQTLLPGVNRDILIAAAVWHDFAKIHEYESRMQVFADPATPSVTVWVKTEYIDTIGHIAGSAAEFRHVARNTGVDPDTIDAVTHCILAHHGRREWGSPVEPQTIEAMILHHADMMSSRYGATANREGGV